MYVYVGSLSVTFEPDTLQLPPTNTTIFYAPNTNTGIVICEREQNVHLM